MVKVVAASFGTLTPFVGPSLDQLAFELGEATQHR
jgi:hypothetical protein